MALSGASVCPRLTRDPGSSAYGAARGLYGHAYAGHRREFADNARELPQASGRPFHLPGRVGLGMPERPYQFEVTTEAPATDVPDLRYLPLEPDQFDELALIMRAQPVVLKD